MSTTPTPTVWHLARLADCADPDSPASPGARFLVHVAEAVNEAVRWEHSENGLTMAEAVAYIAEDGRHEIADGAVPIPTRDLWAVFVDLGAYDVDFSEFGGMPATMDDAARMALYDFADRLALAYCQDLADDIADTDDEDVPADWPVRPYDGPGATICNACGRGWIDTIPTSMTPAPSGRCPFEQWH